MPLPGPRGRGGHPVPPPLASPFIVGALKVKTCGPICKLQPGGSGLGSVPIRVHCSGPGGLE